MDMKKLKPEIAHDEGFVYEIYLDHLGYPTFGIGHLIVEGDPEFGQEVGTEVSAKRVSEQFDADLQVVIKECEALYGEQWDDFPEEVQHVLCNMMFNLGRTRLAKFKNMRKAIDDENWATAAKEGRDSLWYKQVTNRAERLMTRLENV